MHTGGKCYSVLKKRKQLFLKLYKLAVIFIALVILVDSAHAYSNQSLKNVNSDPLSGNKEQLSNVVGKINSYLPLYNVKIENKITNDSEKPDEGAKFLEKPVITGTQSREEIEREKAKNEEQKKITEYQKYRNTFYREESSTRTTDYSQPQSNSAGNSYYYGYCTWYVKNKRPDLPNQLGNGGAWYYNAQIDGLSTGQTPQEGSVIVTGEGGVGHVGYVESVNGDQVTISEMNFSGWGTVNERTINTNSPVIKGFVY